DRSGDEAVHDVAALAFCITEISEGVTGDAARGKHQRSFFFLAQWGRSVAALKRQRPAWHFHSQSETTRAALAQRGQERVIDHSILPRFSFLGLWHRHVLESL